jgi:cytochrome c6
MRRIFTFYIAVMTFCLFVTFGIAGKSASATSGEAGFKQHCSMCHPNGGNIINRQKPLNKKNLDANHIIKPEDIILVVRKGAPGMPALDKNKLSDEDAMNIANYILNTFK